MYAHNPETHHREDRKLAEAYNPTRNRGYPQGEDGGRSRVWYGQWKRYPEEGETLRVRIVSRPLAWDTVPQSDPRWP